MDKPTESEKLTLGSPAAVGDSFGPRGGAAAGNSGGRTVWVSAVSFEQQWQGGQHYPDSTGQYGDDSNSPDKKRMRMLNAERQKALISDTEKLLKLAKELNDEVTESDSASMSDAQLRKVAEIGKLAHSVKEKMSYSVGGFPGINTPLTILPGIQ